MRKIFFGVHLRECAQPLQAQEPGFARSCSSDPWLRSLCVRVRDLGPRILGSGLVAYVPHHRTVHRAKRVQHLNLSLHLSLCPSGCDIEEPECRTLLPQRHPGIETKTSDEHLPHISTYPHLGLSGSMASLRRPAGRSALELIRTTRRYTSARHPGNAGQSGLGDHLASVLSGYDTHRHSAHRHIHSFGPVLAG